MGCGAGRGGATSQLLLTLIVISAIVAADAATFKCSSAGTCWSLIDYVSPNTTTLEHIKTLFGVKNLRNILGVNGLSVSTARNYTVVANQTIRIPFRCVCANGTGRSNHLPMYTVQKDDGLYHIAAEVFGGVVTYQEIAAANNITDFNKIDVGQLLWIPMPCSCDSVNGSAAVHYGHVVEVGSSVSEIATKYGADQQTILQLNGIDDPKSLKAGEVLDVPLEACTSAVSNDSLDYPLLVSNGTYTFTANNCVMCKCDAANNRTLQCESSGLKPSINSTWSTCPTTQCQGNLFLGNTSSGSDCDQTMCAYAGYNTKTILSKLVSESSCPANTPANHAVKIFSQGSSLNILLICIHFLLFFLFVK
ncbi:lysM domain-containing GPI-anchored protein 2 isoform X2 [Malania oleifera]|uniref:lysM domain-containing GPI-anchored protein 2 isoform X2 n=1 Tax=Malania oleifera TaxID=397392 RepID=UPI0025AE30B9|nr:lysM domain-containing GPI-anchored protein 2 isoform X2 [Malania oleifera]